MIDDKFIAEVEGILPLVYDDSLSYYEVLEKVTYLLNECIQKVNNIADPVIYTPTVNEDGTISWTNNGGLPNPEPVDISGPIGPAPSISVTDITGGHRITIVDEDHPDGINIDVMNGAKGEQGDAGVSPAITITDVLGGHRITITDAEHPQGQSFNVMNGDKGEQGDAGVSPTVTITDILGGHRITITDAAHPQGQNFDVMDGAKGDTGAGVPAGGTTGQILAKLSDADYDLGYVDDTDVKSHEIAIVITGARPSIAVTAGQYVIVRKSAISGITDGLYTANSALSPSTDVTAANLMAVSNGGLNSLSALIDAKHVAVWPTPTKYNSVQDVVDAMSNLPINSFLLNTFGGTLRTDLFATASSYNGIIACFKASGNNIYYLAFSRDVAGIGNINITNVGVTIKHDLL